MTWSRPAAFASQAVAAQGGRPCAATACVRGDAGRGGPAVAHHTGGRSAQACLASLLPMHRRKTAASTLSYRAQATRETTSLPAAAARPATSSESSLAAPSPLHSLTSLPSIPRAPSLPEPEQDAQTEQDRSCELHAAGLIAAAKEDGCLDASMRGITRLPRSIVRFCRCDIAHLHACLRRGPAFPPSRPSATCRAEGAYVRRLQLSCNRLDEHPLLELLPQLRELDLASNLYRSGAHARSAAASQGHCCALRRTHNHHLPCTRAVCRTRNRDLSADACHSVMPLRRARHA